MRSEGELNRRLAAYNEQVRRMLESERGPSPRQQQRVHILDVYGPHSVDVMMGNRTNGSGAGADGFGGELCRCYDDWIHHARLSFLPLVRLAHAIGGAATSASAESTSAV